MSNRRRGSVSSSHQAGQYFGPERIKEQRDAISKEYLDSIQKSRKKNAQLLIRNGFRLPGRDFVPWTLPKDRSTWTRDQCRLSAYGPVYQAIQAWKPKPLQKNDVSSSEDEFEPDDDDEEDYVEKVSMRSINGKRSSRRKASTEPEDKEGEYGKGKKRQRKAEHYSDSGQDENEEDKDNNGEEAGSNKNPREGPMDDDS